MDVKVWRVLGLVLAAICVVAVAVALGIGGCEKGIETAAGAFVPMKCHYAMCAVALVEIMAALSCAALAFVKCKVGRRWLAVAGIAGQVLSCVALYSPFIGLCGDTAMRCHSTAHIMTAFAVVVVIGCIVAVAKADPHAAELPKRGL